jgi:hypothetical protein
LLRLPEQCVAHSRSFSEALWAGLHATLPPVCADRAAYKAVYLAGFGFVAVLFHVFHLFHVFQANAANALLGV